MPIHDELIAAFETIQKRIDAHAKEETEAKRSPRNVLLFQVRGKCDGAIAILKTDKANTGHEAKTAVAEKPAPVK
jgi:hypothetical protein